MIRQDKKYTLMRKNRLTGKIEEGISDDNMQVMENLLRAAYYEDTGWFCWVRENNLGPTRWSEVFSR